MSKILGIDLGTTNSAMAYIEGGEPKIIENKEGNRTTPSMVALTKNGERQAGLLAKRQAVTNPANTLFSIKRLMGRRFSDPEVQKDKKLFPFEIQEAKNGGVEVKLGEKWHSPQEISAMILQKLKQDAEEKLGEKIEEAIITVPAYFDDSQRQATKDAGEIAGFKVKRIINEPTAAALAYGINKKNDEKVVVYDFGGGTFDVSVLEIGGDTIEVKSTGGDTHLGGDDFDQKVIHWLIDEFKKDQGIDLSKDVLALQRLKEAGEKAKHELSTSMETEVNIPFVTSDAEGPKHLNIKLTRAKLEELVSEYIKKSVEVTEGVVKDAGLSVSDINEVILVGGQTRMPAMQEAVKNLFSKEPHKGINPDEVVASGAAIQGGVLQGDVKDILLLDVIPLSLGIETLGGVSTKMIEKNTTIPVSKTQIFSTAADNQPSVEVHVLQGEREMATDNKSLGRFMLDGIPSAPRGVPQVEVSFDVDANGILNVKAQDKVSGKEQSIRIEASSGLSKEEIEKMKKDAELHADEDKKKKESIETKNTAESTLYSAEKTISEFSDKIEEADKKELEEKVEALKKLKDSEDMEAVKKATEELSQVAQKVGAAMYQKVQQEEAEKQKAQSDAGEKDGKKEGEEEPIEGEVEETKEEETNPPVDGEEKKDEKDEK